MLNQRFDVIAFDADDTLWHDIPEYYVTEESFIEMLLPYHDADWIKARLFEADVRNLKIYGYGVKGYVLSMLETAIELTEGRITGAELEEILRFGRKMLTKPIDLLPHVQTTLETLKQTHALMLITKGDLFHQESKLARSGLADYFEQIEIVSNKGPDNYRATLKKYSIVPERMLMVGNSLKSDIMPVCAIGGNAVYIPYDGTWEHEQVMGVDINQFAVLKHIGLLPHYIRQIEGSISA